MSKTTSQPPSYTGAILGWGLVLAVLVGVSAGVNTITAIPVAQMPFYKAAQTMCADVHTPPEGGLMSGPSTAAGELPNVGAPSEIIVAPACFKYPLKGRPVTYQAEVIVYLVISNEQIAKLGDYISDTLPFGVQDRALTHLVTKQQRLLIEHGSQPNTVEYVLTTPSMNAARVQPGVTLSRFEQQTLPRDILSGTYYQREPSPSVREAYTLGPVIVLRGTK